MKLQEPCSLAWQIPSTQCLCPSGPAPLPRPAQEAWPSHRAACPEQGPAQRAFFSFLLLYRGPAMLPCSSPGPSLLPESLTQGSVSVLASPAISASVPGIPAGPQAGGAAVRARGCGALGPPGVFPLPVLLRVGSRPMSMGISAAEPLSICPDGSAAQGSAGQGHGVSLRAQKAGECCTRPRPQHFKMHILSYSAVLWTFASWLFTTSAGIAEPSFSPWTPQIPLFLYQTLLCMVTHFMRF